MSNTFVTNANIDCICENAVKSAPATFRRFVSDLETIFWSSRREHSNLISFAKELYSYKTDLAHCLNEGEASGKPELCQLVHEIYRYYVTLFTKLFLQ